MRMAWDTGSTYSLVQRRVTVERMLALQDGRYTTGSLLLESHQLGPHRMIALDLDGVPELDGVLGANFFARHRVCFDHRRLIVSVR